MSLFACLLFAQTLAAQTTNGVSEEAKASAIQITQHIQDKNLVVKNMNSTTLNLGTLTPAQQLTALRQSGIDALTARKNIGDGTVITIYAQKAEELDAQIDMDIAHIYQNLSQIITVKI